MTDAADDDWQLIRAYAEHRSQSAFAAIVHRYVDLVHAAARRQVRDADLAHDVAQAVFILLANKADTLTPDAPVSAWLLKTTRYAANNALKMQRRRQHHEHVAAKQRRQQAPAAHNDPWSEIAPHLDGAMAALPPADRDALLLRYFENKPLAKVGTALGVSADAAEKRVSRAVDKLRKFFTGRGVTLSAAIVAGLLATRAAEAAPAGAASAILAGVFDPAVNPASHAIAQAAASMTAARVTVLWVVAAAVVLLAAGMMFAVASAATWWKPAPARPSAATTSQLTAVGPFVELRRLPAHPAGADALAFTHVGQLVTASLAPVIVGSYGPAAGGGDTSLLRVLNLATAGEARRFDVTIAPVTALAVSVDDARVASSGGTGPAAKAIHINDLTTGRAIYRLLGNTSSVTALAFLHDRKHLVSAAADKTVRVWNLDNGTPAGKPIATSHVVTALAASPDGRTLAYIDGDAIKIHDLVEPAAAAHEFPAPGATHLSFTTAGQLLWADATTLNRYNPAARGALSADRLPLPARVKAFSPDGRHLLLVAEDRTVRLFQLPPKP